MNKTENKTETEILCECDCDKIPFFTLNTQGKTIPIRIADVYDGDTIKIIFNHSGKLAKFNCRIYGIDTPEIRGENKDSAIKSRNRLLEIILGEKIDSNKELSKFDIKKKLNLHKKLHPVSIGDFDKYGRLLIELFTDNNEKISQILIKEGLGKEYFGGTK